MTSGTPQVAARRRDTSFTLNLTDDLIPSIRAGQFRITASQDIQDVDTGDHLRDATRLFEVRAPQFSLPPDLVVAVNPAPESSGDLGLTLAHITLASRPLPWLRVLDPRADPDTGPVKPRPPWLALLVFAERELPGDPGATGEVETMAVDKLLWPDVPEERVLTPDIPRNQVVLDPNSECATILVPATVFAAVCPREEELRHLVHVRGVRADARLRGEKLTEGDFAVILANRLPNAADGRHVAHLVSLEGCLEALGAAASDDPAPPDVRLVSLHRWSFECLPAGGAGFGPRVHDLLYDDDNDQAPRDLLLRVPTPDTGAGRAPDAAEQRAHTKLKAGWVPLPYQVASGEETYAWYRGPLTASLAPELPPSPTGEWSDAGQLLIYDDGWGLFDAGWASAWTLGRSLALADDDFAAHLSAWRSRARFRGAVLAQRLAAAPGADATELARLARPHAARRALAELAATGAAETLLRALNDPPTETAAHTTTAEPQPARSAVRRVLQRADTRTLLREALSEALESQGQPVAEWLARLRLLYGVPFAHLVPSEAMLPPESLKFFHVDPGWLTALQAGAESLGVTGEADTALAALAAPWVASARHVDGSWPQAGLLIRSALAIECPELIVRAWKGTEPVRLLRQDLLDADILLYLFDEVPDEVELSEPPEGLSFGIDPHPVDGIPVINLRSLGTEQDPIGQTLQGQYLPQEPGERGIGAYLRPDPFGRRVLDLRPQDGDGLVTALGTRLRQAGQPLPDDSLSPAALALQLVNAPFRQLIHTHLNAAQPNTDEES
ncbi:hypothetical protein [Kitasatospora sp. NPDC050467]